MWEAQKYVKENVFFEHTDNENYGEAEKNFLFRGQTEERRLNIQNNC